LVGGLVADLPRKHCWTIAEHAGDATPDGLQHLLAGAVWDHDGVRDDVRGWLVEHLGDRTAVLVVDETGDLKKGTHTVGVARQYTGTAGKVDNAQVAVDLAYATAAGHRVIDRELYLPQGRIHHPARCHAAGVPAQRAFATKPELARVMLRRALKAGVAAGGVGPLAARHQVRRWRSWFRWVTLAILASAFLVVTAVTEHARHPHR
jgi:SRSO17 transposase